MTRVNPMQNSKVSTLRTPVDYYELAGEIKNVNQTDVRWRALACAIIHRSIMDLHVLTDNRIRNDALAFFKSTVEYCESGKFTFLQCCEILDIHPQRILKKLTDKNLLKAADESQESNLSTYKIRIRTFFV